MTEQERRNLETNLTVKKKSNRKQKSRIKTTKTVFLPFKNYVLVSKKGTSKTKEVILVSIHLLINL